MRTQLAGLTFGLSFAVSSFAAAQAAPPAPEAAPAVVAPTPPPPPAAPADGPSAVLTKFSGTLYGFAEFDAIHDSTQSMNESAGNPVVAKEGTYAGDHGRTTFGMRNSRFGFKLAAPQVGEFKASAQVEVDFLGNQPSDATEQQVFTNPAMRVRHYYLKVEDPYVDFLFGQTWQLFGWQGSFHPNTVQIQGVPGEIFGRAPQARLSHTFKTDAVNVEIAVAASRPPQRNSEAPDGQGGLRFMVNSWKGVRTAGSSGTSADPLTIGVSGVMRHFSVPEYSGAPKDKKTTNGWGLSVDALLPVIPGTMKDRANALTLTGSFVTGAGISDLYAGLNGGVQVFSGAVPNPTMAATAPTYTADVDRGMVVFDTAGNLHAIKWQSYIFGVQYYLPFGGLWISGNYSHMNSDNISTYTTPTSTPNNKGIFNKQDWYDVNLFWDATNAVRFGAEYAHTKQTFGDNSEAKNDRLQFSAFYIF